jgi:hypothetical protein
VNIVCAEFHTFNIFVFMNNFRLDVHDLLRIEENVEAASSTNHTVN